MLMMLLLLLLLLLLMLLLLLLLLMMMILLLLLMLRRKMSVLFPNGRRTGPNLQNHGSIVSGGRSSAFCPTFRKER